MTGQPPTCSDSTDVPAGPSVGKLQTTLHMLGLPPSMCKVVWLYTLWAARRSSGRADDD